MAASIWSWLMLITCIILSMIVILASWHGTFKTIGSGGEITAKNDDTDYTIAALQKKIS
jgi:hypothetical protein